MINPLKNIYATADQNGHLVLPPEIAARYGIKPGAKVLLKVNENGLQLSSAARLSKLHIEPTNRCNLNCRTCIRHVWDEPYGLMSDLVFDRIIDGLRSFPQPLTLFFGGFGEPILHPKIVEMLTRAKDLGCRTELITNGTLLTSEMSLQLIRSGLDMLWTSLDGATPQSYADIRLGAELPGVVENLRNFSKAVNRGTINRGCSIDRVYTTQLGVEFVATKNNIADLAGVLSLGQQFGATQFIVTNVLPYTREMCAEILYNNVVGDGGLINVSMPRIDGSAATRDALCQAARKIDINLFNQNPNNRVNQCPFIQSGSGAIRWDGSFSPCLPLMHSHSSYLPYPYQKRLSRHWTIGNIAENDLAGLWFTREHLAFREKVLDFAFSPCTSCGGCELLDSNEEDCFGNSFPTCGGCLWSQGLIRCP